MNTRFFRSEAVWIYFGLVLVQSLPFWLIGPKVHGVAPIDLPISALWFVNVLLVALLFSFFESGTKGVKQLLSRSFDLKRIKQKAWYVPILLFWPMMMLLEYAVMRASGAPLPDNPAIDFSKAPLFLVLFLVSGLAEELGWQAYVYDRMQNQWSALEAGIIIGLVWGLFHAVPLTQTARSPAWILWQCLGMIPFRILIVWLYNNTGQSLSGAALFHAMSNVSQFSFPNYGSHYDSFIAFIILTVAAATVVLLWRPAVLTRQQAFQN